MYLQMNYGYVVFEDIFKRFEDNFNPIKDIFNSFEDIFMKIAFIHLKISSNNGRIQRIEYMLKQRSILHRQKFAVLLKADMNSDKPLQTAAIFFISNF